ncbi:hypothetical protein [Sulfurospirillum cavolei]|uniref:hypothetical protein n=1 Tax=Sulfurospirillum cavolei TaxID=366522 RepID=UPI003FA1C967
MFSTVLELFTGTQKWVYIALSVLVLSFIGNISLYINNGILKNVNDRQEKSITKQESTISELQNTLVEKRGLIDAQNARLKQMEADKAKNEAKAKEENEAISEKYKSLRDSLNFKVDENATNANDVKQFINGFHWVR